MKYIYLLLFLTASTLTYSHSGGPDRRGGHHDRINGGYHFHHGCGPHQHSNGKCPLDENCDLKNNTDTESNSEAWSPFNYKYLFWGLLLIIITVAYSKIDVTTRFMKLLYFFRDNFIYRDNKREGLGPLNPSEKRIIRIALLAIILLLLFLIYSDTLALKR